MVDYSVTRIGAKAPKLAAMELASPRPDCCAFTKERRKLVQAGRKSPSCDGARPGARKSRSARRIRGRGPICWPGNWPEQFITLITPHVIIERSGPAAQSGRPDARPLPAAQSAGRLNIHEDYRTRVQPIEGRNPRRTDVLRRIRPEAFPIFSQT